MGCTMVNFFNDSPDTYHVSMYQNLYDYFDLGRGGAIGKTRGSESDDRSPLVSGSNPVAAAFAFAKLRKKFRRVQNHNQEGCG